MQGAAHMMMTLDITINFVDRVLSQGCEVPEKFI